MGNLDTSRNVCDASADALDGAATAANLTSGANATSSAATAATESTSAHASAPHYFMRDGKLTRRTFIKGVGAITVASAFGFGAQSAQDAQAQAEETPAKAGEKSVHAVCTVNCTSRCHLHGIVRDGKLIRVEQAEMHGRP